MKENNFTIRVLQSEDEIIKFGRLLSIAWAPDRDPEKEALSFRDDIASDPGVGAESMRGAFDPVTGRFLGAYLLFPRQLCIGPARLAAGCIGGVVVASKERRRGVASALMRDAIAYAQTHKMPLLFLSGIPNFYHRLDYVPVIDEAALYLERDAIQALPPVEDITVRNATEADASTLLTLYQAHFHPYIGSFERSLAEQLYLLRRERLHYLLAYSKDGQAVGYMLLRRSEKGLSHQESAASEWPAISALLQEHERWLLAHENESQREDSADKKSDKAELTWKVPPESRIFYHLAEHVPFRCESQRHYSADWMARIGDLQALVDAMLPAWTERVLDASFAWSGRLNLTIGDAHFPLQISQKGVQMIHHPTDDEDGTNYLSLTHKAFTQLCFGYRPVAWFATQPEQHIPPALLPLLNVLFPVAPSWVAGSDYF